MAVGSQEVRAREFVGRCVYSMYVSVFVCGYVYMYRTRYVYIHTYTRTGTHTHTHTHTHTYQCVFIRGSRLSGGAGAGVRGALCKTRVGLDEPTWGVNEAVERMRVPGTLQHAATRCNTPEHSALC